MTLWVKKWGEVHHGAEYAPGKVDWVKLSEILRNLKAKEEPDRFLARWEKVIATILRQPEEFGWQGHRLAVVVQHWPFVVSETAKTEKGGRGGSNQSNGSTNGDAYAIPTRSTRAPRPGSGTGVGKQGVAAAG